METVRPRRKRGSLNYTSDDPLTRNIFQAYAIPNHVHRTYERIMARAFANGNNKVGSLDVFVGFIVQAHLERLSKLEF